MERSILFVDIDTQFDLLDPRGKLYIRGSEKVIPAVSRIRRFALTHDCSILATVDWHTEEDGEIDSDPDFKDTFPPHCLAGSPGAVRVGDLGTIPIDILNIQDFSISKIRPILTRHPFHLELRKNRLDLFTFPQFHALFDWISPHAVIVFGVALDVCVYNIVRGLLFRRREEVILLSDAVKGLGRKPAPVLLDDLHQKGARITSFENFITEDFYAVSQR